MAARPAVLPDVRKPEVTTQHQNSPQTQPHRRVSAYLYALVNDSDPSRLHVGLHDEDAVFWSWRSRSLGFKLSNVVPSSPGCHLSFFLVSKVDLTLNERFSESVRLINTKLPLTSCLSPKLQYDDATSHALPPVNMNVMNMYRVFGTFFLRSTSFRYSPSPTLFYSARQLSLTLFVGTYQQPP
ncbi:hypothetical protein ONZ45_g14048 [Pleurotus djamor]|nr:hypothetical protein ONZ45_g14048 [Pleurotus djamor]